MKKIFFFSFFFLIFFEIKSQDPTFTMINQNYSYVNPAFTGTSKNFRTNLAYRNQWISSRSSFKTTSLMVDQHLSKIGGVGLLYLNDKSAESVISSNLIGINYAKQIKIRENGLLSLGVFGSWYQEKIDVNKLTFSRMSNPRTGFVYTPSFQQESSTSRFDFGLGALYYTRKFYIGYGILHLKEPNISEVYGVTPLPRKHSAQMGFKQEVTHNLSLLPTFYGTLQQKFLELTTMLELNWKWLIIGGGISSVDNGGLGMIGVNYGEWRLLYSYDESVSMLTNQRGGSHGISLQKTFHLTKNDNERPFLIY